MNDLERLKRALQQHRALHPQSTKRFPKNVWEGILTLCETQPPETIAQELGICLSNLRRKISKKKSLHNLEKGPFVPIPFPSTKTITIELPHNIRLKIET